MNIPLNFLNILNNCYITEKEIVLFEDNKFFTKSTISKLTHNLSKLLEQTGLYTSLIGWYLNFWELDIGRTSFYHWTAAPFYFFVLWQGLTKLPKRT